MSLIEQIDKNRLPQHVAIIMDGNGRWAKAKGKDRSYGHQEGVVSVRKVVEAATTVGLKYLTMYTFSTENWNRPEAEVQALMSLLVAAIHRETPDLMKNNVRLMAIGNLDRLPADAHATLQDCIAQTSANTGVTLILALSYSALGNNRSCETPGRRGGGEENKPRRYNRGCRLGSPDNQRYSRSGFIDPYRRRTTRQQLPALAVVVCRILLYRCVLARF